MNSLENWSNMWGKNSAIIRLVVNSPTPRKLSTIYNKKEATFGVF